MKAESIRNFAAGILVAAGICGAVYYLGPSKGTSTVEEMKSVLADNGYVVHTQEEWNKVSGVNSNNASAQTKAETKEETKQKLTLTVSSGMTSYEVSKALEQAKIIKSAKDFRKEVENQGVSSRLRLGTFEIDSSMTTDQIISILFKK
jgi:uncharacterized membrane protein